ncbi:phytosulfokin receptor 1 [Euphorbia peplus]|nr:phytosulfokin receptor 1 [Euphorbia peplus]
MMSSAKQSFFPFLFAATFLISLANASSGCISRESVALLKFKNGLTDPSNKLKSWDGETDCCSWYGVICDNLTGHVHELHLHGAYIADIEYYNTPYGEYYEYRDELTFGGNVSESLLDLKQLQYLDLSSNNFIGNSIPEFLGSFPSLRFLNLSEAGFYGLIPPQLGNLSNLQYLAISPINGDLIYVEELE